MDALSLARAQFAVTTIYHFLFVPLTIGLSLLVAILESIYVKTNDEKYKQMAKFWGKLFLINFSMGVVTGIVQEFQFGMNWSGYSRFVGDIFGAPLAIEALVAFFLESTFLGVWIFGWDKLSKKVHLLSMWLAAIGTSLSAFWILLANSFMQNPVGYTLNNGRAEMESFTALLTNGHLWWQFPHVLTAGLTTAGFFIVGVSAINLLKKSNDAFFTKSFKFGSVAALIGVVLVLFVGHGQMVNVKEEQPMKAAAAEALWETADPAPFTIIASIDEEGRKNNSAIELPKMLSFLYYLKFEGEVPGINDLQAQMEAEYGPGDYIPPVKVLFWSFRIMVGAGCLMLLLGVIAVVLMKKKKALGDYKKLMVIFSLSLGLPFLANTFGWIMAEMGRYPWLVYGLQKLEEGVSVINTPSTVLISLVGFIVIYTALAIAEIFLMVRHGIKNPVTDTEIAENDKEASLWT
ncbi:MAG: cytochrome ubiquinol oxidase subunit I [Treponema sp.]|nr:cytochrome ubiquinol oxidase subunit I [Treponema sp.]